MRRNRISIAFTAIKSNDYKELPVKVRVAFQNWIDLRFKRVGLSYLTSVIENKFDDSKKIAEVREKLRIADILKAAA